MFHRPKYERTEPKKEQDQKTPLQTAIEAEEKPSAAAAPAPAPAAKPEISSPVQPKPEVSKMSASDHHSHDSQETQARAPEKSYSSVHSPAVAAAHKARPFAGGYPGSISAPAAAPSSYSPAADSYAAVDGRKLVIGPGITMSGEIEACDHLIVEGTVEAALKGASVLDVAETGVFYGTVEIDEATIAGRFEGDLIVNGRLTVRATGSVTGTLVYKEFAVEAGATIDGKVSPLAAIAAGGKKPQGKETRTKSVPPRNDNQTEGSELPFAAGVTV